MMGLGVLTCDLRSVTRVRAGWREQRMNATPGWESPLMRAGQLKVDRGGRVEGRGEGELRGDAGDGSQNPRICQGNHAPAHNRQQRASYELTARTIRFLGKRRERGSTHRPASARGEDEDSLLC
jgi:hypothetical protein